MDARAESQAVSRLRFLARVFFFWGAVLLARLIDLQIIEHEELARMALDQQQNDSRILGPRGAILDRNGQYLARSLPVESVCLDPRKVHNLGMAADLLARVLSLDSDTLLRRLVAAAEGGRGFLWVKRRISPEEAQALRAYKLDWVEFRTETKRYYPKGSLGAPLIGSVDYEEKGNGGVELGWDKELRGKAGVARTTADVRGGVIDRRVFSEPEPGKDLTLTIDERVQFAADRALRNAVRENHCRTGSLVVMDPRTGDILAMSSVVAGAPVFDPNKPPERGEPAQMARLNLAVSAPFEPGSVFKVITVSAALETTNLTPETIIPCGNGRITLFRRVIHDHDPYSLLSVADVLAKSSNIGAIQIGLRVGNERLYDYIKRFGFGRKTGVLPGESPGIVRPTSRWIPSSIGSIAMGHEVTVTTLQLAQACSAIANGGVLVRPRVVLKRQRPGFPREAQAPLEAPGRAVRPETAIQMRQMMERVVLAGTGKKALLEGYTSGGKTGSAQIYDFAARVYTHKYNASFMGFAPVNNPAVVVVVTLNGASKYGGAVAAPVFHEVAAAALRFLDVPKDLPDRELPETDEKPASDLAIAEISAGAPREEEEAPATLNAPAAAAALLEARGSAPTEAGPLLIPATYNGPKVPNFQGKTKRLVIEESAALGLLVEFRGDGIARVQEPPPGMVLRPGERVRIQFAR
ncbi:MAG: transpeptidase family protein [Acidobacteria bacterium]|nr:transpeptidase family protein [Acidobacteriota bacterium]MBI3280642.1 transpeptidase family protein [Acidobacteriota bacterium]